MNRGVVTVPPSPNFGEPVPVLLAATGTPQPATLNAVDRHNTLREASAGWICRYSSPTDKTTTEVYIKARWHETAMPNRVQRWAAERGLTNHKLTTVRKSGLPGSQASQSLSIQKPEKLKKPESNGD